jgi:hypothetical protein
MFTTMPQIHDSDARCTNEERAILDKRVQDLEDRLEKNRLFRTANAVPAGPIQITLTKLPVFFRTANAVPAGPLQTTRTKIPVYFLDGFGYTWMSSDPEVMALQLERYNFLCVKKLAARAKKAAQKAEKAAQKAEEDKITRVRVLAEQDRINVLIAQDKIAALSPIAKWARYFFLWIATRVVE